MIPKGAEKMEQRLRLATVLGTVLCVFLIAVGTGCPLGIDSPPKVTSPDVDLAVGDAGIVPLGKGIDTTKPAQVLLYFNVLLGNSLQDPDVVLSEDDFGFIQNPISIQLTGDPSGNDLYVADNLSNTVAIWRDYRDLVAKGSPPSPDVLMGPPNGICDPFEIMVENNRLFVSDAEFACAPNGFADGAVFVFDQTDSIENGAGDLPSMSCYPPSPKGIAVAADILYVAATGVTPPKGPPTQTLPGVYVFDNITGRIAEAKSSTKGINIQLPSTVLSGPSFLNIEGIQPWRVDVFGNRLFVTTLQGILFVFNDANALVDEQAPAAVIAATTGSIGHGGDMKMLGDTLYIGNTQSQAVITKSPVPDPSVVGMTAFRPGVGIVSGQNPVMSFDPGNSQIERVNGLSKEKDTLFAVTGGSDCPICPSGDVEIFYDADTLLIAKPADLVLPGLKDFFNPISIDANDFFRPIPTN